ncbi:MAG: leucyl aminopeptidase, partial [Acidimicrobiia bacterium]|nr:leucyl aminopeptidase [Acidimicrobiia bacterium]
MIEFRVGGPSDSADAIVVGVGEGRRFDTVGEELRQRLPWLGAHLDDAEFTGKTGQVVVVPGGDGVPYRKVALVGLGGTADAEQVRQAAGGAARALAKCATVATTLHAAAAGGAEAVGIGFTLGAYTFTRHKTEKKPSTIASVVMLDGSDDDASAALTGATIGEAVNVARDLVNEPAMGKSPVTLAERATAIAAASGLGIRVLDEHAIAAERLGGLRGVSLGATNPARLVELRYEPEGARGFLAVVGKGIVFDSGGLSLKPADSMETMKTDMSGAAAVFASMQAIAA